MYKNVSAVTGLSQSDVLRVLLSAASCKAHMPAHDRHVPVMCNVDFLPAMPKQQHHILMPSIERTLSAVLYCYSTISAGTQLGVSGCVLPERAGH